LTLYLGLAIFIERGRAKMTQEAEDILYFSSFLEIGRMILSSAEKKRAD
jgi:hypothetical protein